MKCFVRNASSKQLAVLLSLLAGSVSCSRTPLPFGAHRGEKESQQQNIVPTRRDVEEAKQAREEQKEKGVSALVSPETATMVRLQVDRAVAVTGSAHIGLLYFKDQPAHRLAVLAWLAQRNAVVGFESTRFGYIDARVSWQDLADLIDTSGVLGLDEASLMKLELDQVSVNSSPIQPAQRAETQHQLSLPELNSSFFGPAHSAGYGAKVQEFRATASADLNLPGGAADLAGQGRSIAVFDQGIDLSRTDVFGDRILDFFIGNDTDWREAGRNLEAWLVESQLAAGTIPGGLSDVVGNDSLRFLSIPEAQFSFDLNGSGRVGDDIAVAVYEIDGHLEARVRPAVGMDFGQAVLDFGAARRAGLPAIIDMLTGRHYHRDPVSPSWSAAGFKLRKSVAGAIEVAIVGTANGSEHGLANLHMAGGDYVDPSGTVRYQGVAPGVSFYGMQSWKVTNTEYGSKWIPLARSIIQAADVNADVIDLDIYTPGSRGGNDLMSSLACRIANTTDSVLVAAAHNFGPLPDTIQSMAQSPCILGIGASHSVAALKFGRNQGSVDPRLVAEDSVQTAHYSGRGFGMNGQLKPDIISPAYGYTAYGRNFIRFGGTSGATPTTAGMIVLLKQAAAVRGITLTHEQIRFLLQTGSRELFGADSIRDGYGYSDLLNTWTVLSAQLAAPNGHVSRPFAMLGQTYTSFDGRPNRQILNYRLQRVATKGSVDGPQPMTFTISFSGPRHLKWLKFYDAPAGSLQDTLSLDSPLQGETQNLRLKVELTDEQWGSLPAGQYVALVKGVRAAYAGTRGADFLLPVTFSKGADFDESVFTIRPLYADQHQTFEIAANPGDRLLFTGMPQCLGREINTGVLGQNNDGLVFTVDHEAVYPHASSVMNSYAPLVLGAAGIQVTAQKGVVHFDIRRSSQFNCDGAIGGKVVVRRTSIGVRAGVVQLQRTSTGLKAHQDVILTLQAGTVSNPELNRASALTGEFGDAYLTLRREVTGDFSAAVPEGCKRIRVIPASSTKFRGVLATSGGTMQVMTSDNDAAGLASLNYSFEDQFIGLEITNPTAGEWFHYIPATKGGTSKATILLEVEAGDWFSQNSSVLSLTEWLRGQSRTVAIDYTLPSANFVEAFGDGWSYGLKALYTVKETQSNNVGNAGQGPLEIWKGFVETPFAL